MGGAHRDWVPFLGVADGIAPLDASSKVPLVHIPEKARTQFFPVPQNNSNYNGYRVRSRGSNGNQIFNFQIPADADVSLGVSGFLVGAPTGGAAGPGKNIDLELVWATVGTLVNSNVVADTTSVYDLTGADTWQLIEFSPLLAGIVAGAFCGLEVDHNGIGGTINYLGVTIGYFAK